MLLHNIFKPIFLIAVKTVFSEEVSSDEFVLKERILIDASNIFDQHKHLSVAKVACSNDSKCIGVYEASCDDNGPFMLIKNGFLTSVFGTNCIYKKRQYAPELGCFDISMYKPTNDFGWSFGHCSSSGMWLDPGTYTQKCCLSGEVHVLTCINNSPERLDWSSSALITFGHQFCDDVVGHISFIPLNISALAMSFSPIGQVAEIDETALYTAFIPDSCINHINWAYESGKYVTEWFGDMKSVVGVDAQKATRDDFQRYFKCRDVHKSECADKGLTYPSSCSVPPCSVCNQVFKCSDTVLKMIIMGISQDLSMMAVSYTHLRAHET